MKRFLTHTFYIFLLTGGLLLFSLALIAIPCGIVIYNISDSGWVSFLLGLIISIVVISVIYIREIKTSESQTNLRWHISYSSYMVFAIIILSTTTLMTIDDYQEKQRVPHKIVLQNEETLTLMEVINKAQAGDTVSFANNTTLIEEINALVDNSNFQWKKVVSEKGNFSILFPNYEVKQYTRKQIVGGKELPVHYLSLNTQEKIDNNIAYSISFFEVDTSKESLAILFETQKRGILSKTNGVLESEFIVDSLNYPCRELYITIDKSKTKATARMIYNQGKFYQVMVLTQEGNLFNKAIQFFLNSFTFLKTEN